MTTIAFDGKTLAADSQSTRYGHIRVTEIKEKIRPMNKMYVDWLESGDSAIAFAGCGTSFEIDVMYSLIFEGQYHLDRELEAEAILLTEKGGLYMNHGQGWYKISLEPVAIGSGEPFARSAMHLGLNAVEAVEHASKFDTYTGGQIMSLEVYI